MVADIDKDFYNRADAVIHLANDQLSETPRGKVSASCMYATSRFNAWVTEKRGQRKYSFELTLAASSPATPQTPLRRGLCFVLARSYGTGANSGDVGFSR